MSARVLAVAAAVTLLWSGLPWGAAAQQEPAARPSSARSLDELLQDIRRGGAAKRRELAKREQKFKAARAQQRKLVDRAKATLAAEERRSDALEKRFQANETAIVEGERKLRNRLGTLGELFGVVRQVAGDTRSAIESSLVSAQRPGRGEFLEKLAQSKELPSIAELRALWITLQEEMTESGKVVRFPATVITTDGREVEREAIRVGVFNAMSDGKYLDFIPESGKLVELGRQPAGRHLATVEDLESATQGLVAVSIDPSRGALLSLLIQTPSAWERVQQGQAIGYIIIVLGSIGVLLAIVQWIYLLLVDSRMRTQLASSKAIPNNPLGRVLGFYEANRDAEPETLELKLDEAILKETPALERFLTTVKVLSVVAPLLGLLGTVTGMIQTFQSITLFGAGDPKLMAGGISQALVTTMLGLIVAIPLTLLHSFVSGRSRTIIHVLDEQSAGVIAAQAERERGRGPAV